MNSEQIQLVQPIAAGGNGLNHLDKRVPVLEALGQRHGGYGVKPADYDTVRRRSGGRCNAARRLAEIGLRSGLVEQTVA